MKNKEFKVLLMNINKNAYEQIRMNIDVIVDILYEEFLTK